MTAGDAGREQIHYTHVEPSPKTDATPLMVGVCTCGYRSSPGTASRADQAVRMHFEAKHSHD